MNVTKRLGLLAGAGAFVLAVSLAVMAQDAPQRPEGGGGGMMGRGQGVGGTVTAIAGSDYTIKTEEGDVYKVTTTVNTRIMKDRQPAKAADIHVGDMLMIGGVVDAKAKTVGAAFVAVVDAEQVKKMREDLGKTWVAGKVTAIDETKITIHRVDGVSQTIAVDENTSFRSRKESVTLADIKVGDNVNARGALKDGVFVAAELGVGGPGGGMMMQGGGRRACGAGTGSAGGGASTPATTDGAK
jgi:Domain of unknown function (DUF5666)